MKAKLFATLLALLLLLSPEQDSHAARTNLDASPWNCAFSRINNGNFEQRDTAWLSIPDPWHKHALIAPFGEAYDSQYSAVLGGDEHTVDSIRQQVTIPAGGPAYLPVADAHI